MEIVKGILTGIYLIISVVLIILVMLQSKQDAGMSATITGASSSSNFFEQNKGRTKEGKQKKWTIILAVAFVVVGIALSIIYPV